MFTGIIRAVGHIAAAEERGGDLRVVIECAGPAAAPTALGDSVAVNGVCLTAIEIEGTRFTADVSRETLALTTLGALAQGDTVNLEPALTLATPLGGHLVSGHVDGVGQLVERRPEARSTRMVFEVPAELARYVARKGSIAIDGTSLTVNDVAGLRFGVNIVPHTLENTIMGAYTPGVRVNLEADLLARYLERLMTAPTPGEGTWEGR